MTEGCLFTRSPRLHRALNLGDGLEIGNLNNQRAGIGPKRSDDVVEVLCNRQKILGNPFSAIRLAEGSAANTDTERARQGACRIFEEFFNDVMVKRHDGLLSRIAEAAAQRLGHSVDVVGQEWT